LKAHLNHAVVNADELHITAISLKLRAYHVDDSLN
jgi:hypothetical protein